MSYTNCGTEVGWKSHKAANEPPCKWCRKAMENPAPVVTAKPKAAPKPKPKRSGPPKLGNQPAPCGTSSAYQRHLRNNDPDCEPCRKAANARRKEQRKTKK
jgi:hypothetical protein